MLRGQVLEIRVKKKRIYIGMWWRNDADAEEGPG